MYACKPWNETLEMLNYKKFNIISIKLCNCTALNDLWFFFFEESKYLFHGVDCRLLKNIPYKYIFLGFYDADM